MEWTNIKDKLPPIGKKILMSTPTNEIAVLTLGYAWRHEQDLNNGHPMAVNEKMITCAGGYWLLIPELPIASSST